MTTHTRFPLNVIPRFKTRLRLGASLLITALGLSATTSASATCLGLSPPAPEDYNVCRVLVEDLLIPQFSTVCKPFSSLQCIAMPHCCIPGVCLTDAACTITSQAVPLVFHAGDVYCGLQEISAEEMVSDFVNDRFTDFTTLVTGGANSPAYRLLGANIDVLECQAKQLTASLRTILKNYVARPGAPSFKYQNVDVDNVRISKESAGNGAMYLPGNRAAITLGTLVIINDQAFNQLVNWNASLDDVRWGRLTPAQRSALFLIAHELVHVRQYRELGSREKFINQYLPEVLFLGYGSDSFESEAFGMGGLDPLSRNPWAHRVYWGDIGVTQAIQRMLGLMMD